MGSPLGGSNNFSFSEYFLEMTKKIVVHVEAINLIAFIQGKKK